VNWRQEPGGVFALDLTVPPNATASIHLPVRKGMQVREGRAAVTARTTARLVSRSAGAAVVEVGSGRYRFEVR
jgi:alpha-L-rhamnosidase